MPDPISIVPFLESPPSELHRWTRRQYEGLITAGVVEEGLRVELLDGIILDMPVQNPAHYRALRRMANALRMVFGEGFDVREQAPFALDDLSAPEPDIAVVEGSFEDYQDEHPSQATLIVEISGTSLAKDRGPKKSAYARNGIAEYWILNLPDQQLEVYRAPSGDDYLEKLILNGGSIDCLAKPGSEVSVTDLLQ